MQSRVHVLQGDITTIAVDVIVNAANSSLLGGGGVDGAIHRVAGPALLEACKQVLQQQGECPTGHAVITLAGNLPAKAVIHTVMKQNALKRPIAIHYNWHWPMAINLLRSRLSAPEPTDIHVQRRRRLR